MSSIEKHHKRRETVAKRPNYRQAQWERAVKVYTINQESQYLLVQGVPSIGVQQELIQLFSNYGELAEHKQLADYPREEFTEVYLIKYQRIQSARVGKRKLDNRSFYGGQLHVCYALEYESVEECRKKLNERRRTIERKCREFAEEGDTQSKSNHDNLSQKSKDSSNFDISQNLHHYKHKKTINNFQPTQQVLSSHPFPSLPPPPPSHTPFFYTPSPPPPFENRNADTINVQSPIGMSIACNNNLHRMGANTSNNPVQAAGSQPQIRHNSPTDHPRVPTNQATLPAELRDLTAQEVYPAYYKEKSDCVSERERQQFHGVPPNNLANKNVDETLVSKETGGKNNINSSLKQHDSSRKRIMWNKPTNKQNEHDTSFNYTKEPGAWDPYKDERRKDFPAGKKEKAVDEIEDTINDIRSKLTKSAEPSTSIRKEEECPLQSIEKQNTIQQRNMLQQHQLQRQQIRQQIQHRKQQQHIESGIEPKKKKNDVRKRI